MLGDAGGSALAVAKEEASTKAQAAGLNRAVRLSNGLSMTAPPRSATCDSCVPFHGHAPLARHSGAYRRRRRGRGAPALAMGADRLRASGHDLDALGRD